MPFYRFWSTIYPPIGIIVAIIITITRSPPTPQKPYVVDIVLLRNHMTHSGSLFHSSRLYPDNPDIYSSPKSPKVSRFLSFRIQVPNQHKPLTPLTQQFDNPPFISNLTFLNISHGEHDGPT